MLFRIFSISFLIITLSVACIAGEGMWLPQLLKMLNEKEMKSMGMKLSAEDIYSVNKGSLKDAIVHFGGFCTSELISPNGLLLTNHHCGYGQIQSHSSVQNNLIKNGFWAKNLKDELPNPGLTAIFIDYIDDVTTKALEGINPALTPAERQSAIDKNISEIRKSYTLKSWQSIIIRPFFDGNQYFAFVTTTYKDVRLVGTPPESIGKFGADTDNWVWPRHTGDFALFRIYAGPDNNPADYSPENVPFKPKHFLPISLDGVEENDFTMVFGFPGRTQQYLPGVAVKQVVDVLNPAKIKIRETALNIMDKYMRKDEATKIKYASKYASIANAWKKWIGENLGIKQTHALQKKTDFENEFKKRLNTGSPYAGLLDELTVLYKDIEDYALARDYYLETIRNVELLDMMNRLRRLVNAFENNGESGYTRVLNQNKEGISEFYKDFDAKIDSEKFGALLTLYVDNLDSRFVPEFLQRVNLDMKADEDYSAVAENMYMMSDMTDEIKLQHLLSKSPSDATAQIRKDPMYALAAAWSDFYSVEISNPYNVIKQELT
jgi:hypothetical protein